MIRILQHPWGWSTVAPLACAVHCVIVAVLVALMPALSISTEVEWIFLAITVLVALVALASGRRAHGHEGPAIVVVVGIAVWLGSLLYRFAPIPEDFTTPLASLTAAAGLLWNSRLHCAARAFTCTGCKLEAMESPDDSALPTPAEPSL